MMMAVALMICITFKLKFWGLSGSFLRKKYIYKYNKKRGLRMIPEPSEYKPVFY
jgi:hypothetical protein